jgi:hypothetical protein
LFVRRLFLKLHQQRRQVKKTAVLEAAGALQYQQIGE